MGGELRAAGGRQGESIEDLQGPERRGRSRGFEGGKQAMAANLEKLKPETRREKQRRGRS